MKAVLMVFISVLTMGWIVSCGSPSSSGVSKAKVYITLDRSDLEGEAYGLTGETPAFVGLLAQMENGEVLTRTALTQELSALIEVDLGSQIKLNASVVSYRYGDPFLYVSQAAESLTVDESTEEVVLSFTPYAAVRPANLYGVIHRDANTPAPGPKVTLLDPVTGAPVFTPGQSHIAVTNELGAFATCFPIDAFGATDRVRLQIEFEGVTRTIDFGFAPGAAPGVTLPFADFGSGSTMGYEKLPAAGDFDGDGSSNGFELAEGTNPFSELAGARGSPGVSTLSRRSLTALPVADLVAL